MPPVHRFSPIRRANLNRVIVTPPSRGILSGALTLSFGWGIRGHEPNVIRIRDRASWLVANETGGQCARSFNIHFFQKCCNSQLIGVAFTIRRR
jgi:hypothetical protein